MDPLGGQDQAVFTVGSAAETSAVTNPDPVAQLIQTLGLSAEDAAEPTALIAASDLEAVATRLKAAGFMLMDVVGVDYGAYVQPRPQRFSVLYNVYHPYDHRRLFLRVWLRDGESLPSLFGVWKSANYLEREVYDLMGVVFDYHPDLRKILTPDDLEGHPLRKDFPLEETPTLFRDGRFIDPPTFRAGMTGQSAGLTGWRGSLRKGGTREMEPPVMPEGGPK